jgi:CRISPR-associated exonuclease Cas4
VEQQWEDNFLTAEGNLLHAHTDRPQTEKRRGVRTVTAMPLSSDFFGLTGIADVVELREDGGREIPYPVEYKRGSEFQYDAPLAGVRIDTYLG